MLDIEVKSPAYYIFTDLKKAIAMDSYIDIPFEIVYKRLPTSLYRGLYEASVKYNKSTSKWEAKIAKDSKNVFDEDTGDRRQDYLDAISIAIEQLEIKPKKYITFELKECSLRIDGQSYQMPPKAIIVDSMSLLDKLMNQ